MKRCLTGSLLAALLCGQAAAGTLAPGLERMLAGRPDDEIVKVLVVMQDQADVAALDKSLHDRRAPLADRHAEVVSSLQTMASASQRDLLAALDSEKAAGQVVGYTPHWIVNAVVVTASVARVRELALRPDVLRIEPDLEVELIAPVAVKEAAVQPHKAAGGFLTPGVKALGADRVWHELGIDGTGTLVGNLDSGVDGTHPALAAKWRGNFVSPGDAWQDRAGVGSPFAPVDLHGHGTHVMGTITGVTAFDTTGVAPGAQWLASNGIFVEGGAADLDNAIIAAFEWFTDPDGDPLTTDDVPDVVQNSWGVSPRLGPYLDCDSRWWEVIDNCEAAGVVVVFAAGNEGPVPGSLRSPGNRADTPTNCFTVGSTSTAAPYPISYFSARGPSQCGGPYAIKPEVMAPGQDILSSYPGGGWAYMSGTSMAGPHVAGVVSLMRQANPDVDVTTIKEILMETASDLGAPGEDNDYGHGIVDAYRAVLTVLEDVGTVRGTITDADTGLPLEGAVVAVAGDSATRTVGVDGSYGFTIRAGDKTLVVTKYGYDEIAIEVTVPVAGTLTCDIAVPQADWARIGGIVHGPDGAPLGSATVTALDTPLPPVVSAADGTYELHLPAGPDQVYDLKAVAPDLAYDLRHVGLQGDVEVDFHLPADRVDGFEAGAFAAVAWEHAGDAAWTITADEAHEGTLSARSGVIDDSQTSELALDYYVNGAGPFSFWLMTESETVYDRLVFYIDGVERGRWSDRTDWTLFTTDLTSGLHRLRWVYTKDSSTSVPRDAVWIDEVKFPGTGVRPFPSLGLDGDILHAQADAGAVVTYPLSIANHGDYRLDYAVDLVDPSTGEAPTWVVADAATGQVHPGNTNDLLLHFDGRKAPAGGHTALLTLTTNDPDHPDTTVTLDLAVAAVSAAGDAPRAVVLRGGVPNPFNPATDIRYALPRAAEVTLDIFDVAGRRIRRLASGPRPAGEHSERWNGRDDGGRDVASGIYFVRLRAAGTDRIGRLTLVR